MSPLDSVNCQLLKLRGLVEDSNDLLTEIEVNQGLSSDPALAISSGLVSGLSKVNKFGGSPEVAANTEEDVWDGQGTFPLPSGATVTHIRAAVDSVTTRGALIEIQGLNANSVLTIQTKALDATDSTTEVALDTPLRRVFRKKVLDGSKMDQNIWSGATGMAANTANSVIQAGNNQTLMAVYSVPASKQAYITNVYWSVINATNKTPKGTEFKLWAADTSNGYTYQLKHADGIPENASIAPHPFNPYKGPFSEKTDIKISAQPSTEPGKVYAGFDIILVDV